MLTRAGWISRAASSALGAIALLAAVGSPLSAQERTGWFHIVYVDPPRAQRAPAPLYGLVDAQGRWTRLLVDDGALRAAGGPRALAGRRVSISGEPATGAAPAPGVSSATPTLLVRSVRSLEPAMLAPNASLSASRAVDVKRYVMLLCNFSDQTYEPLPRSWYDAVLGSTRPNMAHYFNEISYGRLSLAGSMAVGWFTLPKPWIYYYPGGGGGGNPAPLLDALLKDCVAAADATVDFTQYAGIIVQHNVGPDWAYGGSWTLTVDGQTRTFGVAWMPKSGAAQLAHEIGHTLKLPHSSGGYEQVYDSRWDVMSWPYVNWDASVNSGDWVQQHTIMFNKAWLGWIDGVNQLQPPLPSTQSVMLLRGAQPPATAGYHLVKVPDSRKPGTYYVAEARRLVGYDQGVPGDAVVLHTYDPSRSEPAHVVDVDRNYDPNDAGAMWTPGESFTDSLLGLTIDVDSMNSSGFGVTVVRGWRLRVQATGPGRINGSPAGPCVAQCDHVEGTRGTTLTLTAQPNPGAQFIRWTGACAGSGACSVTLAGNRTVGAAFAAPVTLSSGADRPRAVVGRPYEDKLLAAGGLDPINWSVTAGTLPPGITLTAATGALSGEPTTAGRFEFTITATSGTLSDARKFTLNVVAPVTIASASARRAAVMGTAYADTVRATGGNDVFDWRIVAGALPAGLAFEPGGVLQGIPTASGTFRFTARATSDGLSAEREFELTVAKPVIAAGPVLDLLLGASSTLTPDERGYLDLIGNRNGRVDIGDVRAWLVDLGALSSGAPPSASMTALSSLRDRPSTGRRSNRATTYSATESRRTARGLP